MNSHDLQKFLTALDDGSAYAARILSRMARVELIARPARIFQAERAAAPAGLFPAGDRLVAGLVGVSGDLFGQTMLVFDAAVATQLAQSMSQATSLTAPEGAVLEESVNIFANTAISSITRDFRLSVYAVPPKLVRGSESAVWKAFVEPVGQQGSRLTVVASELSFADRRTSGRFVVALRDESLDSVRWKSAADTDKRVDVKIGDLRVAAAPGILKVTSLGSCLAVILYDPSRKVGAMAHVVLPNCAVADTGRAQPGKFADTAVEAMLKVFQGTPAYRLRAWLIGGASMFSQPATGESAVSQIGRQNVEVVKRNLAAAGITRYGQETGGSSGRTVELDTSTGQVTIHGASGVIRVVPAESGT